MAKPTNTSINKGCGDPTTTECVFWEGENIPCLGIERGQSISISIKNVADEVCAIKDMLDLSDIDLKCVFDLCLSCPEPEKTLKIVLQLLINKVCDINDIVKDLSNATTATQTVTLRLASCFQYTNLDGDNVVELPHEEYTKRIANKVCDLLISLNGLDLRITELDDEINNPVNGLSKKVQDLENSSGDEVSSDCLFVGLKSVPDAYSLIDQAFCQLRTATGSSTDVNKAISQQCIDLNVEFGSTPGWNLSPVNMAQTLQNLWIVMCSVKGNVKVIQDTCCAFDCDDVKIGFIVSFEDGFEVVRLRFTSGSGTNIPTGFTDTGSVLTVSDESGNTVSFILNIENNGEQVVNLLGLKSGDKLTFSIESKLSNGDITCQQCITKVVDSDSACNYCEITASGSGTVVITYSE